MNMRPYDKIFIWENRNRVKLLKEFRNLVIEYYNNVERNSFFSVKENEKATKLRTKINLILDKIYWIIKSANVETSIFYFPPPAVGGYSLDIDLICNIFNLARYEISPQQVLDHIERAIGIYEEDKIKSLLRTFNPFTWIMLIIEYLATLPFKFLEILGFNRTEIEASILGKIFKGIFQFIFWFAALLTVLEKFELLDIFKKWIYKLIW